ncbi:MAG: hypothetical protein HKP27_03285, partial [Myxococcales bacterium]|nr:hypothetical protein [Myxococcales bacterium]
MELAALAQADPRGARRPLREPIARLAARLTPGRWLLTADDPQAFAVGLFALAHANAIGVVPPNTRPGTLRELGNGTRGRLVEGEPAAGSEVSLLQPKSGPAETLAPLDPERPLLELFTSGSTGHSQRVSKSLNHLAREVDALESCFGGSLGDA